MNAWLTRFLLKCFPVSWQAEYGPELEDLLTREPLSLKAVADVFWSACKERVRQPIVRFYLALLVASVSLSIVNFLYADDVWRFVCSPVIPVFRSHGIHPSALRSDTAYEQLVIVWFGLPLVSTALVIYPCFLILMAIFVASHWVGQRRRQAYLFAACSGMVFAISLLIAVVLWRQGVPLGLLLDRNLANSSVATDSWMSVGRFFSLLVSYALAWLAAWQIPVLLLFAWRRYAQGYRTRGDS